MFTKIDEPQSIVTLPTCKDMQAFTDFIDGLLQEHSYILKVASTIAANIGIGSLYGIITAHLYSSQAAILIFQPLTAGADIYKLRKYQGAWDSAWVRVKTTTV